jgi:type II secretory pathway component GspD/PulD (secretin)
VEITAKFMEVQQSNLKELGFQYSFSYNDANLATNGQRSSHRLSFENAAEGLLRASETSTNGSLILINGSSGGRDGLNYKVNVNALNQLSSSDALASPRIITMPGTAALIKMVRSVPFVDEYDDGEQSTSGSDSTDSNGNAVQTYTEVGPMPSFQDPTDLGITMNVTPEVDYAQGKITLELEPLVRTQVGWLNWDYTDLSGTIEKMRKPILAERTLHTKVTISDGKTVVIGGVVDDTANVLNDKIPILGDLPLVGRFFQSKYTDADKRYLLIFVTCRLINPDGTPYSKKVAVANGIPQDGRFSN